MVVNRVGGRRQRSAVVALNAVWAGPVSALPWVPLSAYAADGKPAACSKGHAVQ